MNLIINLKTRASAQFINSDIFCMRPVCSALVLAKLKCVFTLMLIFVCDLH